MKTLVLRLKHEHALDPTRQGFSVATFQGIPWQRIPLCSVSQGVGARSYAHVSDSQARLFDNHSYTSLGWWKGETPTIIGG